MSQPRYYLRIGQGEETIALVAVEKATQEQQERFAYQFGIELSWVISNRDLTQDVCELALGTVSFDRPQPYLKQLPPNSVW